MHIILYSHVFLPIIGGIQSTTVQYAQGLMELGHRVTVVTETPAPRDYDKQFQFPVVRLDPNHADWKALLTDVDVIVSNGYSLKHFAPWRKLKIPFGWIHAMAIGIEHLTLSWFGIRLYFRYRFRRFVTRYGHFNICVSNFIKQHVGARNGVVIYNPINPMFQKPQTPPPPGPITFVGRIWNGKGVSTVIEALKICREKGREIHVEFFGEGQDKQEALDQAGKLGVLDLIKFNPFLSGDALVQTIQRAKFILVPTIVPEAFGLAAAEAMACGKCVIGSRVGGLGEILEGINPTFESANADQLAALITELNSNPQLVEKYEKQGYESSHRFRRETICKQMETLLKTVVEAKARRKNKAS